jgi:hypothetical protein
VGDTKSLWDQYCERLAEQLSGCSFKHLLRGRVENDDALLLVDCDDRVHRGTDDFRQDDAWESP